MKLTLRRTLLTTAALTAVGALVLAPTAMATEDHYPHDPGYGDNYDGRDAVGLAGGELVGFSTADPGAVHPIGTIVLDGDEKLVGIDFRVQDGLLYGVGDRGGLYTVSDDDASTSKVGQLTVALEGEFFGVDFNPAANALRVISDSGQNLRQPFAALPVLAPTAVDTPLTNPATAPATGTVPAAGVTGAAYTNNDVEATTATTLFDLDTALDRVSIQSPANAGTLAPTGNLPADIGPDAGFDIFSTLTDGVTTANDAYASVEVNGKRLLWTVDLLTGGATDRGEFGADVTDIAIALEQ